MTAKIFFKPTGVKLGITLVLGIILPLVGAWHFFSGPGYLIALIMPYFWILGLSGYILPGGGLLVPSIIYLVLVYIFVCVLTLLFSFRK